MHICQYMPFRLLNIKSKIDIGGHSKKTFVQDSRVLTRPSPLVRPCLFSNPLPPRPHHPKVRSFWLELTLSPSISIIVKFREKKLHFLQSKVFKQGSLH